MAKKEEIMNKSEILDFINSNPACCIATIDGTQPRARGILIYHADEKGILFQTWSVKDLYRQIQQNRNVEICFINSDGSKQVRVSGKAELVEDQRLKEEIANKRSFLKPWVEKQGYDSMKVFRVIDCVATVWTAETNFEPKKYIRV